LRLVRAWNRYDASAAIRSGQQPPGLIRLATSRRICIAITFGLKISELRRVWNMQDGELTGPEWELTFYALHSGLGGGSKSMPKPDGTVTWRWV